MLWRLWGPLTWLYYIEGGLLTQVQTHAMETLGPINLAVLYRGWPANTGPNTCYGDFGAD